MGIEASQILEWLQLGHQAGQDMEWERMDMSTTQAFRTALQIPLADPASGEVVTTLSAGDLYVTGWAAGAAGSAFPDATGPDQFLVTETAFPYLWKVVDMIDAGTF
jgi:hypothetical protein